ncbi:MAG: type 4a pilus biogenesis protein PilO [bacterium]
MRQLPIIIISFSVTLILAFGFVLPKKNELSVLQNKITEKEAEIQFKEEYLSELENVYFSLEKYQPELEKINSALPQKAQLPGLYNFFEETSSNSGLVLTAIGSISRKKSEIAGIDELVLPFTVSGSYFSLKSFLSALENSARFLQVENISFISPQRSAKREKNFSFDIKIKAYSEQ